MESEEPPGKSGDQYFLPGFGQAEPEPAPEELQDARQGPSQQPFASQAPSACHPLPGWDGGTQEETTSNQGPGPFARAPPSGRPPSAGCHLGFGHPPGDRWEQQASGSPMEQAAKQPFASPPPSGRPPSAGCHRGFGHPPVDRGDRQVDASAGGSSERRISTSVPGGRAIPKGFVPAKAKAGCRVMKVKDIKRW